MWTLPVCLALMAAVAPQAAGAPQSPRPAQATATNTKDINLRAYVELLRSDVRSQKIAIITEMMEFSDAEDAAFWPIIASTTSSCRSSTTSGSA